MTAGAEPLTDKVGVVILTWNARAFTKSCLDSLFGETTYPDFEVVVVDNGSTDGTLDDLRGRDDLRLIENGENLGFARAANRGLARATGRYVLFLNPDARCTDEAVEAAIGVLETRPRVGLVGVAERDATGVLRPTVEPFFSLRSLLAGRWEHRVSAPQGRDPVEIDWCHGAFLLGRRDDLCALGGFDERYFLYAEDMDLCLRVHESGRSVVYLPQVSIVHSGNRAGEVKLGEERPAAIFASSLQFYGSRHGVAAELLLRGIAAVFFGARAALLAVTGSRLAGRYAALARVAAGGKARALATSLPAAPPATGSASSCGRVAGTTR